MYSDLLRTVLETEGPLEGRTTMELIADVVGTRRRLGAVCSVADGTAAPIGDALAYDAALVRLCDRLNVEQHVDARPDTSTRRTAEVALAARLPVLADALTASTSIDTAERLKK